MTESEAAWLAGILEGEGCFDFNGIPKGRYPRIRLEMKDADIIDRVVSICGEEGMGKIRRVDRANEKHSSTYCYQIARKDKVKDILVQIHPWMGSRKAAIINDMLDMLGNA